MSARKFPAPKCRNLGLRRRMIQRSFCHGVRGAVTGPSAVAVRLRRSASAAHPPKRPARTEDLASKTKLRPPPYRVHSGTSREMGSRPGRGGTSSVSSQLSIPATKSPYREGKRRRILDLRRREDLRSVERATRKPKAGEHVLAAGRVGVGVSAF